MDLKNKKVTVVGLGNSGLNAAILLDDMGADVRVTDSRDNTDIRNNVNVLKDMENKIEIGGHTRDFIEGSELVILSPGVEDSSPAVRWATELKVPVISELELGFRFCKGRIIAITGTNGKSTVTTLIGEVLKKAGMDTVVCGNIGNSLCGEIRRISGRTFIVLEASSFQLERTVEFKPHIAAILNIADDHLDRYKKFMDYFNEKLKIFRNQDEGDVLILNYDAKNLRPLKDKACSRTLFYSKHDKVAGAYVRDGEIICSLDGEGHRLCSINDIRYLKGAHNLENVLVSSLVSALVGVDAKFIRDTIRNFKGLPHRFETIGILGDIEFVDDSKGTTVDSTYRALESCEVPVILIAGGRDKNSDYTVIKDLIREKVRFLILIGEARERIKKALGDAVDTCYAATMSEAVEISCRLAKGRTLVLLSPMCSSFDMFKDYKERGEAFKEAVRRL
ncbi:MAG: UDP-N-acetylmuramoyl-L-alanine--D-glutamate ligase [Candidatus Omnitrophica bacterium]|nr:UDP-N-acetylmuramoyl-L-alanine--D-glutamate ligase [Candidatus Omnitrophota bacterium]